jgi:hypothetical protein
MELTEQMELTPLTELSQQMAQMVPMELMEQMELTLLMEPNLQMEQTALMVQMEPTELTQLMEPNQQMAQTQLILATLALALSNGTDHRLLNRIAVTPIPTMLTAQTALTTLIAAVALTHHNLN